LIWWDYIAIEIFERETSLDIKNLWAKVYRTIIYYGILYIVDFGDGLGVYFVERLTILYFISTFFF
jgi:hypothetical protein